MKIVLASLAVAALLAGCSSAKVKKTMNSKSHVVMRSSKATAHKAAGMTETTVTCTKKKDKRVAVVAVRKNGCILEYTKFGKTKEIASGGPKSHHCTDVQNSIRKNLTKAGFKCQ